MAGGMLRRELVAFIVKLLEDSNRPLTTEEIAAALLEHEDD